MRASAVKTAISLAKENDIAGIYPPSLKHFWKCTENTGDVWFVDAVGGANIPTRVADGASSEGTNQIITSYGDGTISMPDPTGALSNTPLAADLTQPGTNPWIHMVRCTPGLVGRWHYGWNNDVTKWRILHGTNFVGGDDISNSVRSSTAFDKLNDHWVSGTHAVWAIVFDGTDLIHYKDGVQQGTALTASFGNLTGILPNIGISGIDRIGGVAMFIFDGTIEPDYEIALETMSAWWVTNPEHRPIWPYWNL